VTAFEEPTEELTDISASLSTSIGYAASSRLVIERRPRLDADGRVISVNDVVAAADRSTCGADVPEAVSQGERKPDPDVGDG
jgi:hypothetical protein